MEQIPINSGLLVTKSELDFGLILMGEYGWIGPVIIITRVLKITDANFFLVVSG